MEKQPNFGVINWKNKDSLKMKKNPLNLILPSTRIMSLVENAITNTNWALAIT